MCLCQYMTVEMLCVAHKILRACLEGHMCYPSLIQVNNSFWLAQVWRLLARSDVQLWPALHGCWETPSFNFRCAGVWSVRPLHSWKRTKHACLYAQCILTVQSLNAKLHYAYAAVQSFLAVLSSYGNAQAHRCSAVLALILAGKTLCSVSKTDD